MSLLRFWLAHRGELGLLFQQHVLLVVISTGFAIAVGVPAGILAARHPRTGRVILAAASIAQTIPSLALLGFLLPLPIVGGIGPRTALVALFLYALLPIVRSTATGLQQVDAAVVEAGVAVGMTSRQLLYLVELPLALPAIISGVRIAAVIGVGTTTVAAAVGAGGLGEYIFRGLSMVDTTTILAGAVPAAALALAVDGLLSLLGQRLARDGNSRGLRVAAVASLVLLVARHGLELGVHPLGHDHRRRIEELHRAGHPRRDGGAASRSRRADGRQEAQSRRDVRLRSRRSNRRPRRLRRVHRHGGLGGVSRRGAARFRRQRSNGREPSTPPPT